MTTFAPVKQPIRVRGVALPAGEETAGYKIHMTHTDRGVRAKQLPG